MRTKLATLFLLSCVLLMAAPPPAEAYIDPGAGSLLMQVFLGGTAMVAVMARVFWGRIRALFRRRAPAAGKDVLPDR
jgi:hypothetical protein